MTQTLLTGAFVMNVFDPLRIHLSPFLTADVVYRRGIGTGTRLCESHASDPLAAGELRYVLLQLSGRPMFVYGIHAQVRMRSQRQQVSLVNAGMPQGFTG